MTIGEAIRYYEQLAENQIKCADRIDELHCDSTTTRYMAEHHRQLAEWLRELKTYREIISELSEAMHWYDGCERCQGFREYSTYDFVDGVRNWVKQFEEVNTNEWRQL